MLLNTAAGNHPDTGPPLAASSSHLSTHQELPQAAINGYNADPENTSISTPVASHSAACPETGDCVLLSSGQLLLHDVSAPPSLHDVSAPPPAHGVCEPASLHNVSAPTPTHGVCEPASLHDVSAPTPTHGVCEPAATPPMALVQGHEWPQQDGCVEVTRQHNSATQQPRIAQTESGSTMVGRDKQLAQHDDTNMQCTIEQLLQQVASLQAANQQVQLQVSDLQDTNQQQSKRINELEWTSQERLLQRMGFEHQRDVAQEASARLQQSLQAVQSEAAAQDHAHRMTLVGMERLQEMLTMDAAAAKRRSEKLAGMTFPVGVYGGAAEQSSTQAHVAICGIAKGIADLHGQLASAEAAVRLAQEYMSEVATSLAYLPAPEAEVWQEEFNARALWDEQKESSHCQEVLEFAQSMTQHITYVKREHHEFAWGCAQRLYNLLPPVQRRSVNGEFAVRELDACRLRRPLVWDPKAGSDKPIKLWINSAQDRQQYVRTVQRKLHVVRS